MSPQGAGTALSPAGFLGKLRALLPRQSTQGSAPAPKELRQQKAFTPDKQSLQRRLHKLQRMQITQAPEAGGLQATADAKADVKCEKQTNKQRKTINRFPATGKCCHLFGRISICYACYLKHKKGKLTQPESVPGLQVPPLQFVQLRISVAEIHSPRQKSLLRNTSGGPNRTSLLPGCHRGSVAHGGQGLGRGSRGRQEQGHPQICSPLPRLQPSAHLGTLRAAPGPCYLPPAAPALPAGAAPCPPLSPGPRTAPPRRAAPPLSAAASRRLPGRWQLLRTRRLGGAPAPRHPRSIPGASLEHPRGQPGTAGAGPCERGQERSAGLRRAAEEVIYVDGLARPAVLVVSSLAYSRM